MSSRSCTVPTECIQAGLAHSDIGPHKVCRTCFLAVSKCFKQYRACVARNLTSDSPWFDLWRDMSCGVLRVTLCHFSLKVSKRDSHSRVLQQKTWDMVKFFDLGSDSWFESESSAKLNSRAMRSRRMISNTFPNKQVQELKVLEVMWAQKARMEPCR